MNSWIYEKFLECKAERPFILKALQRDIMHEFANEYPEEYTEEGGNAMTRPDWDLYFIRIAKEIASRSTCLRAAVGAVIVKDNRILATGYNGAPAGEEHCSDVGCLMVDDHCQRAIHAETNAIAQAARHGVSIEGATLYYWDSKGRYAANIDALRNHCEKCGQLAAASGIARVCGRGL